LNEVSVLWNKLQGDVEILNAVASQGQGEVIVITDASPSSSPSSSGSPAPRNDSNNQLATSGPVPNASSTTAAANGSVPSTFEHVTSSPRLSVTAIASYFFFQCDRKMFLDGTAIRTDKVFYLWIVFHHVSMLIGSYDQASFGTLQDYVRESGIVHENAFMDSVIGEAHFTEARRVPLDEDVTNDMLGQLYSIPDNHFLYQSEFAVSRDICNELNIPGNVALRNFKPDLLQVQDTSSYMNVTKFLFFVSIGSRVACIASAVRLHTATPNCGEGT
jgi:hypothetical protein